MMIINIIIILYLTFFNFKTEVRLKNISMVLSGVFSPWTKLTVGRGDIRNSTHNQHIRFVFREVYKMLASLKNLR